MNAFEMKIKKSKILLLFIILFSKKIIFIFFQIGCRKSIDKTIYEDIDNRLNESVSRVYGILIKVVMPGYSLPAILITMFKYISTNDLKNSFTPPHPAK